MNVFAYREIFGFCPRVELFFFFGSKAHGNLHRKRIFRCCSNGATRARSFSSARHNYPQIFHAIKITTAMMIPRTTFFRMSLEEFDITPPLEVNYE